MSFYKQYPNRKDRRKPYRDSRRFDSSCRNHGGCQYCEQGRLYQYLKEKARAEDAIKEHAEGE